MKPTHTIQKSTFLINVIHFSLTYMDNVNVKIYNQIIILRHDTLFVVYQFRFDPQSIEIECFKYQHLMSKLTKDRFVKIHRTIRVHLAAQVLSQNS